MFNDKTRFQVIAEFEARVDCSFISAEVRGEPRQSGPRLAGDPRPWRPVLAPPPVGSLLLSSGRWRCVCALQTAVSVSPSPVEILQSNPTGLQGQVPWGLPALCRTSRLRTFTAEGELLWSCWAPAAGLPLGRCGVGVHPECAPPTLSLRLFGVFDVSNFFGGPSILLSLVVPQLAVASVRLQEEMSARFSTLPSWTWNQTWFFKRIVCRPSPQLSKCLCSC